MIRKYLPISFIFVAIIVIVSSCIKDDQNDTRAIDILNASLPVLTTKSVTGVTQISAISGGRITSDGGSAVSSYGVCWSTNPNPTVNDFKTTDGFGVGNFSSSITDLALGTTYYVRAYAKNNSGIGYGTQQTFTTTSALVIGLKYEGGLIFYLDSTGIHGLVCAEADLLPAMWGCNGTAVVGADNVAVGGGHQNTLDVLNTCHTHDIAARECSDLSLTGYDDWFLPSKEELKLMYMNLQVSGIGNFSNTAYWSSTEMTGIYAWQIVFDTGIIQGAGKGIVSSVRAVRAF